jgi:hypothetical protein
LSATGAADCTLIGLAAGGLLLLGAERFQPPKLLSTLKLVVEMLKLLALSARILHLLSH